MVAEAVLLVMPTETMSEPGAKMPTQEPMLEKLERLSVRALAPTAVGNAKRIRARVQDGRHSSRTENESGAACAEAAW
ncbi:hypothetical protein [Streptomyces sp. NPDC056361]|uniref:hypothetical protein n=1 Tax=Streptomyces sp. NPDC056361 TaxID=3345795 RepID=UPI0035DAAAC6